MRLKSALRRGVAAAVIAGIVVSSGIPAYAGTWDIADGDITVKAGDAEGPNNVKQGDNDFVKDEGDTVITGKSDKHTVTIDTSEGNVDVTFDDLKIDVSGKAEGDGSGDSPVDAGKAAVTVQGDHDATIELDGKNELKSGSYNAGLEKNEHEAEGTLTIKDDKGKDGSLTAEGGDGGGAGIGGGKESTGSSITIRGGTIEAVGGSSAAGIGDGAYRASDDTDDPNPGKLYICGDAEVTAKAGSQILDAKAPAIGGTYGEVPTESLSDADHKVTGGRLTRYGPDGTVMEGMGYDYTSTPTPQPEEDEDDDDDVPPPAQENAPEPLPGGMVVKGFFSSRVTIQQLDLSGVTESGIGPMVGSVKASDAGENLTSRGAVLIESAAPRSTVTTDIPSLREDGVEDIFFRYQDTLTHYSVDKMADAAGEDADVELKQNREDISLRLDGETRDDLSERFQEWVPVWIPEVKERLILTHEHEEVERKTSEELRRELDELLKQEREMGFQFAKKRDDLPSLDWWLEPEREETVKQKTSEELRRELDELLKQEREMDFQLAKKRADHPSLDWWLEPAREETPRIGLDESLKQLAYRFEAIAPEEDKKPLLVPVYSPRTERLSRSDGIA
ncbi:hypothetical protein [Faecalibacterium sp.]|uniref:hypothetical protein n=1 Tax=Faecalibacterium sp. TaxID=1971605 RepID=UPI00399C4A83